MKTTPKKKEYQEATACPKGKERAIVQPHAAENTMMRKAAKAYFFTVISCLYSNGMAWSAKYLSKATAVVDKTDKVPDDETIAVTYLGTDTRKYHSRANPYEKAKSAVVRVIANI